MNLNFLLKFRYILFVKDTLEKKMILQDRIHITCRRGRGGVWGYFIEGLREYPEVLMDLGKRN